jgi:hypothetical protein
MYCVDIETFLKFIKIQEITLEGTYLIGLKGKSIVEYKNGDIVLAKVEANNVKELKSVILNRKIFNPLNKYWIRGAEWKLDQDGNQIKELLLK